jgi:hypothetical protein
MEPKDLIVLVADKNIQATVEGLLPRHQSLGIKEISFDIYPHLHRDPGCRLESHTFLHPFQKTYEYSIVIFDRQGCGKDHKSSQDLEMEVEGRLAINGWENRSIALALDPELEVWVWSNSPHVSQALGWLEGQAHLNEWLVGKNYLEQGRLKPNAPKEAMEVVLRKVKKPRSSSIYMQLAQRVGLQGCTDPAFQKLKATLQGWFPP